MNQTIAVYDSSAKLSAGVISGYFQQLGNYDECLRIKTEHGFIGQQCTASVQFTTDDSANPTGQKDMKDLLTQVALAAVRIHYSKLKSFSRRPVSFAFINFFIQNHNWTTGYSVIYEWNWCLPSSCNYTEVLDTLNVAFDPLRVKDRVNVIIKLDGKSCHTRDTDQVHFDVIDVLYM